MKAFLIGSFVASTFLSPVAQASVSAGNAQLSQTSGGYGTADFQRREGRRGGENPGAGQSWGGDQLHGDRGGAGQPDGRGDARRERRADRGGDNDGRGGWHRRGREPQQPIERRDERTGGFDQDQRQWRDDRRYDDRRNNGLGNHGSHDHRDTDRRQDSNHRDQNWDDRYGNGFDREGGAWDRNDRGHNDRYGNGWDRNEGRWNERRDDRRDGWRDNRGHGTYSNGRDNWHNDRRDDNRWDNSWRNDRRYDWRGHRSQYRDHYRRPGHYYAPDRHHRYHRFNIGISIGSGFYHQSYWLNDPWQYRLPPAHGPYRWVRYYDDVLLVDVRNGYVVDVLYDFFW